MKFPVTVLLVAAMLLAGCGAPMAQGKAAESMEQMTRASGNALENAAVNQPTLGENVSAPLTKEQAEKIALQHAGLTADQVTGLRTEYEVDDGIPRFEVHFRQDRWEYDYEINAKTGDILSYDRDD